jgi:hypothetical protein
MMNGVDTRLDGSTLIVRIPMRFQRRSERKRIVAPDGSELAPAKKSEDAGQSASSRWRWQKLPTMVSYTGVAELAAPIDPRRSSCPKPRPDGIPVRLGVAEAARW